ERDLAGGLGLEQQQRHTAEDATLEALLEGMQADLHRRVLPQERVVLEVDRDLARERHVQRRHELALEAVVEPGGLSLRDLRRQDRWCGRHLLSFRRAPRSVGPAPA